MSLYRDEVMHKIHGKDVWTDVRVEAASKGDTQGWQGDHPSLSRLAGVGSRCIVDVGVWKGQSTITLAKALKAAGTDGCVIAVDTFLGSPEHWIGGFQGLFTSIGGRPNLYETFLSNVLDAGVADIIVPLPQTSVTAAAILKGVGIRPDLVHVDAAHEYEDVKRDAAVYWELLVPGGYLIGDDYGHDWPGVIKAATEFSRDHAVPLQIEGPKWIARKPS